MGIAKPSGNYILQRVDQNGHKHMHEITFQVLTNPDSMCIHLQGLEVRRRHEMFLYAFSQMYGIFTEFMIVKAKNFSVYGDSGYYWRIYLAPFLGANTSSVHKEFIKQISTVRITFEWYLRCVKKLWSFKDSERKIRVREIPVGLIYLGPCYSRTFRTSFNEKRYHNISIAFRHPSMIISVRSVNDIETKSYHWVFEGVEAPYRRFMDSKWYTGFASKEKGLEAESFRLLIVLVLLRSSVDGIHGRKKHRLHPFHLILGV